LSVPRVHTTFASRGFSVAAPTVWNSLPPTIRNSSSTYTFRHLLKTHYFQQAFGSPKCLGFGHWLTLCTINIYLLTYLLTYLLGLHESSSANMSFIGWHVHPSLHTVQLMSLGSQVLHTDVTNAGIYLI